MRASGWPRRRFKSSRVNDVDLSPEAASVIVPSVRVAADKKVTLVRLHSFFRDRGFTAFVTSFLELSPHCHLHQLIDPCKSWIITAQLALRKVGVIASSYKHALLRTG